MENKKGIYKITNKVNRKIYIGMSINLKRRKWEHQNKYCNHPIANAIKKYGWENFEFEVIQYFSELCDINYILNREMYWIKFYKSQDRNIGYNIKSGGPTNCGENNSMWGKHHSDETKKKISEKAKIHSKGERNGMFGKKQTQESIEKNRQSNILSSKNKKPVHQIDPATNLIIKTWSSARDAARTLYNKKERSAEITKCASDRYPAQIAFGFKWRYA